MPCIATLSISIPTLSVYLLWARGLWKIVSNILLSVHFPFMIFNDLGDIFQICKKMAHAELSFLFVRFKRCTIKLGLVFPLAMFKISNCDSSVSSKQTQCSAAHKRKPFPLTQFCTSWACVFVSQTKHVQRAAAGVCQSLQDLTQILTEIEPSASTVGNATTMLHYKVKDFISPVNFCA